MVVYSIPFLSYSYLCDGQIYSKPLDSSFHSLAGLSAQDFWSNCLQRSDCSFNTKAGAKKQLPTMPRPLVSLHPLSNARVTSPIRISSILVKL